MVNIIIGSIVIFICYYLLCFPIGTTLSYVKNMKVTGYWWGLIIGQSFSITSHLVYLYFINWEEESILARERSEVYDQNRYNDDEEEIVDIE